MKETRNMSTTNEKGFKEYLEIDLCPFCTVLLSTFFATQRRTPPENLFFLTSYPRNLQKPLLSILFFEFLPPKTRLSSSTWKIFLSSKENNFSVVPKSFSLYIVVCVLPFLRIFPTNPQKNNVSPFFFSLSFTS